MRLSVADSILYNLCLHLLFILPHLIASTISGSSDKFWSKLRKFSKYDPYVTFKVRERGNFGDLGTALADNKISKSENPPGFITTLQEWLLQKRKLNILASTSLVFCPVDDLVCFADRSNSSTSSWPGLSCILQRCVQGRRFRL